MNANKFNKIVENFKNKKTKNNESLKLNSLYIKEKNKLFYHNFNNDLLFDIRSISKTVLTLVTGIIIDKHKDFTLDTYVYSILKNSVNITNKDNLKFLKQIKVKHLLNHTVGYETVLMMRNDIKTLDAYSLLDYTINYPIKHIPGSYYLYSNASFYLLSATLEEYLKSDLLSFINNNLFKQLNIINFKWEKYGKYLAGATRLWLSPNDLLKIGEVLLNKGLFNDKRIVSSEFVDHMLQVSKKNPFVDNKNRVYRRYAYGQGLWLSMSSIFFGHGTDGQNLVIIPDYQAIILVLANEANSDHIEKLINDIILENYKEA